MKPMGKYITKYLASFAGFIILLGIINAGVFVFMFYGIVASDYSATAPRALLSQTAAAITPDGLTDEMALRLRQNNIWALLLNGNGKALWSADRPEEVPIQYTIQEVAVFSKGYIKDYPVFVQGVDDGLLVLGYPKGSYSKLAGNYYSIDAMNTLPVFAVFILAADLLLLFFAYIFSKRKLIAGTAPIIDSIKTLSGGRPVNLTVRGELSEVAAGLNAVSQKISRQNEARTNWISGVSHDIRTPLSMIMGYADRITSDETASDAAREQAEIIRRQSVKIKELVEDLNLVSRLEYEMQPLQKKAVRIARLLRSWTAELLNAGIPEKYSIDTDIPQDLEPLEIECDERLISRALSNLFQNSVRHNPQGCDIKLSLTAADTTACISVSDNGVGIPAEKLRELNANTHYMESTDDRLNLRHGLGLLLVRQIVHAHNGTMSIESRETEGFSILMAFNKYPAPIGSVCFPTVL